MPEEIASADASTKKKYPIINLFGVDIEVRGWEDFEDLLAISAMLSCLTHRSPLVSEDIYNGVKKNIVENFLNLLARRAEYRAADDVKSELELYSPANVAAKMLGDPAISLDDKVRLLFMPPSIADGSAPGSERLKQSALNWMIDNREEIISRMKEKVDDVYSQEDVTLFTNLLKVLVRGREQGIIPQ